MIGLDKLDSVVKSKKPDPVSVILYLFWDKGISWKEFQELPVPYIMSVMKTHSYKIKEEEKELKKSQRKK